MTVLSWRLRVDEIGSGKDVTFHVPDAALEPLAQALGVDRVVSCEARLRLTPSGEKAIAAAGTVRADIIQTCVVTLDPFETAIVESVSTRFAPSDDVEAPAMSYGDADAAEEGSPGMAETPEPIVAGVLDLGNLVQEMLALGVDPYPRKPGAAFAPPEAGDAPPSPFAVLAKLRGRGDTGADD